MCLSCAYKMHNVKYGVMFNALTKFFYIMYFGLQDTKPPPCPLPLTKQGGSIHLSFAIIFNICSV